MTETYTETFTADAIKTLVQYLSAISQGENTQRFAIVPEGVKAIDLEQFRATPDRIKGNLQFADVPSFVAYVNEYKTPSSKMFYLKRAHGLEFHCELDYHSKDQAKWNDHAARLEMQYHPDYQLFLDSNDKWFDQEEFAIFVEGNTHLFSSPDGATMLELAQDLRGSINAQFQSGKRLSNGQVSIAYVESIEGKSGTNGDVIIPEMLKLVMPIYDGHEAQEIQAAFRWRVSKGDGGVQFSYRLLNLIAERHAQDVTKQYISDQTGLACLGMTTFARR